MSRIKFVDLLLKRDPMLVIPEQVAAWEVPILEAMFLEVEIVGEFPIDREPPEVQDEFTRLGNRYGRSENEDGSKGLPYVEAVYGQHGIGLARLAEAIKAATIESGTDDLMGEVA